MGDGWEGELRRALGILLGRPLDAFDPAATYALYHWDEMLDAEFYRGLDPAAMCSTEESWNGYGLDLGGSLFEVDDDIPLSGDVLAAIGRAAHGGVVSGVDLADVLTRYGVRLADLADADNDYATCGVRLLARVRTDGSLFDALSAATRTADGPHRLTPFIDMAYYDRCPPPTAEEEIVVEPRWEEALRDVRHDALRDHLRLLCLTSYWAAAEGGHYLGDRYPAPLAPLAARGHHVVAGWSFGLGQAASAVVRLSSAG